MENKENQFTEAAEKINLEQLKKDAEKMWQDIPAGALVEFFKKMYEKGEKENV